MLRIDLSNRPTLFYSCGAPGLAPAVDAFCCNNSVLQWSITAVIRFTPRKATDLEQVVPTVDLVQHATLGLTVAGQSLEQLVISKGWDGLTAAGIVPASKKLLVDMVAAVNYPHDKMEGLWRIDGQRLGVINDDDFTTWVNNNKLEQKYLDPANSKIDGNTLYIMEKLDLNP